MILVTYKIKIKMHEVYEFFFYKWLERKLKPSRFLNLDYCKACGYCCHETVCIATPDELDKIAEFLNLNPFELITTWCGFGHFHDVYQGIITACIVYPRFLTQSRLNKAGKVLDYTDFFDTKGCVFLSDENQCIIHSVKPLEARERTCWKQERYSKPILAWNDDILKERYGINIERADDVGKRAF